MKSKHSRGVTPAKQQEVTTMKKIVKKDEIDCIIEIVARWLQPNMDLDELKISVFYDPVRKKIEELTRNIK